MKAEVAYRKAAILAALTAVMVAVAMGLPAMAALTGTPTLQTFKVTVEASTPFNVSFSGNTTMTLNYTPPWPASVIEYVYLKYEGSGDQITIRALDSNGTSLGEVTVVPLASGSVSGTIELAGVPVELRIDPGTPNKTVVWYGTITIIVQSTAQFTVSGLPNSVSIIPGGSTKFTISVEQTAGPAGTLTWTEKFTKNGLVSYDLSALYAWSDGNSWADTTGAGWSDDCTITITAASGASGTYTGTFKLWFEPIGYEPTGTNPQILVAQIDMVLTDQTGSNTNPTTTTPWYNIDREKAKQIGVYAAAGLGVLFVILLLVGGVRLRRSMIPAGLAVLIIAVIAMSAALAFVKPDLLVGIAAGIGAFLVLVILALLGRVKIGE